jgi:hypothetical protein
MSSFLGACYRNISGPIFHLKYASTNNGVLECIVHSFAQTNVNNEEIISYIREPMQIDVIPKMLHTFSKG